MPLVCDTLRIVKDIVKGKIPIDATVYASMPASVKASKVKKAKVEIPHEENPSLYEFCLRTQQALESHIKIDRKVKLEMMTLIDLIPNYTCQALLYEKD